MAADTDSNDEVSLDIGLGGEILATISYSSLAIVGTVGNIMLILVIYRTPSLKTVCGALISNVGVADLMVTAIVMPVVVFSLVQGILGHGFYKIGFDIALMIALFSATASLLTLTMLSMDRQLCYLLPPEAQGLDDLQSSQNPHWKNVGRSSDSSIHADNTS